MPQLTKIGVQLYTIRDFMKTEEEIKVSFERLKKMGYDEVQTAGCAVPYDLFGRLAREAGLTIVGTHDNFDRMCSDTELMMDWHDMLGTKIMGIGGCFKQTLAEYEEFIARANALAAKIRARGFQFTYHNHSHEFRRVEGVRIMDLLLEKLDPANTGFVLDTYWVQHGGGDVRAWIEKCKGRIDILHLKDMAKADGNEPPQYYTEIGNGNLYWEGIIETALDTGVRHFVVEQDTCPGNPFDSLQISSDYLHANFF